MDEHLLIHLADEDSTGAMSKALLSAGQTERMPPSSRSAIAAGLCIGVAASSAVAAGASAASSGGIGLLGKLALVTVAISGLAITGYWAMRSPAQSPSVVVSAPAVAPVIPGPPMPAPELETIADTTPPNAQSTIAVAPAADATIATTTNNNVKSSAKPVTVAKPAKPSVAEKPAATTEAPLVAAPSSLAQEIAAIDRAQQALSAGHFAVANETVSGYMKSFPRGTLRAEAAALQFDIAVAQRKNDVAIALGNEFLQQFPGSPQRQRINSKLNSLQQNKADAAPTVSSP